METPRPLTPAQASVLATLRTTSGSLSLADLIERTGLHENTLRRHLDALVAGEYVTRFAQHTGRAGRPAWQYLARESEYAALALALAEGLAQSSGSEPNVAAQRGGRVWGERLRATLAGSGLTDPRERLVQALRHTGFEPHETESGDVRLTHCPLLDAAHAQSDAVCGVHHGMIEALLGDRVDLVPFAEPGVCVVRPGVAAS